MSHQADSSFFEKKRQWSKWKDQILDYYLKPYLAKLGALGRPITIVDGFAGPGRFKDGELGSPMIICNRLLEASKRSNSPELHAIFIEQDQSLAQELAKNIESYGFAEVRTGRFLEQIQEIATVASKETTFLYLDPFTIEGLEWAALGNIAQNIQVGSSVEILLNFNAASFVRRGLAALRVGVPSPDPNLEEIDEKECLPAGGASVHNLDKVFGDDSWQSILRGTNDFAHKVQAVSSLYCHRLGHRFAEVCSYDVKANWRHSVPKYTLIFASRHPDALEIMNDAMATAKSGFAEMSRPEGDTLFEMLPENLVPELGRLEELIISCCSKPVLRRDLVLQIVREHFCSYSTSQIKSSVRQLCKAGALQFKSDTSKVNDRTLLWRK